MIKDLLFEYRFIITFIIAIILYAAFEWQSFKAKVYSIMLQAKRMAKEAILKSGTEQVEWVIKRAYQWLPKRITIFISEDLMREIIFYLYEKSMDFLDDGQMNNSFNVKR